MDLMIEVNEQPMKKKRGRPKKGSQVKDALVQGNIKQPKKDRAKRLQLTAQNPNEKSLLHNMEKIPKKRRRPKKEKYGILKKTFTAELSRVDAPSAFRLCVEDPLLEEEYNPFDSCSDIVPGEATGVMRTEKVDPDRLAVGDVVSRNLEELAETQNGADSGFDLCASIRCCQVRLERLSEGEKQKHLNCSKEPLVKPSEKHDLSGNLGSFLRYKGSSTRGNFLHSPHHSPDIVNPMYFKFSDDSNDEDYFPRKQLEDDDLDWSPAGKSLKRKNAKNFPANTIVKRAKHKKTDQVSAKEIYSSADNLSSTSTDYSFTETRSCDLYSSGKFGPLAKPEDVNSTQTNSCSQTNLTQVFKMEDESQLIPEVTQSSTESEVKRGHSLCQVSKNSTCPSEKAIEVIDISSDCDLEDRPMKTTLTSDCPSANVSETTDKSKNDNLQIAPMKLEPDLLPLDASESRSIVTAPRKRSKSQVVQNSSCASNDSEKVMCVSEDSNQQVTLEKHETYSKSKINVGKSSSSAKKQKYSKKQVSQTKGDNSLKIVPMKNDSQSITESIDTLIDTRSPCDINVQSKHSKEISQISDTASNTLTTDNCDILKDNSSQIEPLKGDSKLTTSNANTFQTVRKIQKTLQSILKKRNQPNKRRSKVCGFSSNNAKGSNELKTVSMKQDYELAPGEDVEKLPNIWKDKVSRISICYLKKLPEMGNISENSLQVALKKQNSKLMPRLILAETLSTSIQPKLASAIVQYSIEPQRLNVEAFKKPSCISNSLISSIEHKVEDLSFSLISDIFNECIEHCSAFSCNLDDVDPLALLAGCNYCKNFAELDAIASLAVADFAENPKAYIEYQIESTEAMYDKLKTAQPQDAEVASKLKKIALQNRGLKYGRYFLSSYGSFINVSEYLLKSPISVQVGPSPTF